MGALIAVIVRVKVIPPHVVSLAHMMLIREVTHVDVSEDVLELRIVCVRDR